MQSHQSDRPIFHKEIGDDLRRLRTARGWSIQRAVIKAAQKHKGLTANTLRWLEEGKTRLPDPEILRAVSDIYGQDYASLARQFIDENYARDLADHLGDQQSAASLATGGADAAVQARKRIAQLERQIEELEGRFREMQNVASALVKLAALGSDQEREAARAESSRRRSDRKTRR